MSSTDKACTRSGGSAVHSRVTWEGSCFCSVHSWFSVERRRGCVIISSAARGRYEIIWNFDRRKVIDCLVEMC